MIPNQMSDAPDAESPSEPSVTLGQAIFCWYVREVKGKVPRFFLSRQSDGGVICELTERQARVIADLHNETVAWLRTYICEADQNHARALAQAKKLDGSGAMPVRDFVERYLTSDTEASA